MAAFKVGQRVRVREDTEWTPLRNDPRGKEGVVIAVGELAGEDGGTYPYEVLVTETGRFIVVHEYELEPIQYDGNKVVEWSECLWQPEHIRTAA